MQTSNALYPAEYRAIEWDPTDSPMMAERIREELARKKYAEMLADAQFSPGTVIDTHA